MQSILYRSHIFTLLPLTLFFSIYLPIHFWLHLVLVGARRLICPAACGILVPWPGIEPASPALEGRFLATGPPGKSLHWLLIALQSPLFILSLFPPMTQGWGELVHSESTSPFTKKKQTKREDEGKKPSNNGLSTLFTFSQPRTLLATMYSIFTNPPCLFF